MGTGILAMAGCQSGMPWLNHDAGHLRAHKIAQVMVFENVVVVGVGDEQVIAVLACLVVGTAGNLEREAVVETGENQAKGLGGAACELAGALVGQVARRLMVSLMSLRVSGRSFSGWLSALDTVPSETPASRATSLIFTFAIPAPLMRFKYKTDCSIARP